MQSKNRNQYQDSAEKGIQWLLSHFSPDGSFGETAPEFWYYYKTAWALIDTGNIVAAMKLLDFVNKTHFMEDGDFNQTLGDQVDDPFWHNYLNTWQVIAAQKLGKFDIAFKGMAYLLTFHDPVNGGFYCTPAPEDGGEEHAIISSACGLACLYTGKLAEAIKVGNFLLKLMDLQPDKENRFYSTFHSQNGLVTTFPTEKAVVYEVDATKPQQWFFSLGHPIGFLTKLYLATHAEKYLEGAKNYFNFINSCLKQKDGVYSWPASGKVGWGSAVLFNVTRNPKHVDAAKAIADYLCNTQSPNGYWTGYVARIEDQPLFVTVDITAEFVVWLREILYELR